MVNQVCICADRLSISLTLFSHSDFLQPLPLMSVLTAGLRASTTIIVHSCGLSHQSPVRRSALSPYSCQCWGWCTVSQEQHLSLKISAARSIRRSVLFCFLFYVHPFIQMMQIGSAMWTGLTLMTILLLAQWEMGCWGMTLNSVPLRLASLKPIRASLGASLQRHKRNWVWNQFFVLEEYTGDDPLYVGKVKQNISSGSDIIMYQV